MRTPDTTPKQNQDTTPVLSQSRFIDYQREALTDRFLDLTDSLDRFLSRENGGDGKTLNKSYFVVGLDSVFGEGGEHDYGASLKLKADLPHTKQRFKFIFESQPEEDFSLQQNELAGRSTNNRLERETAVAGVEYIVKASELQWRSAIDVGARLDFPADTFARVRFQKKTPLPSSWVFHKRLEFSYFARQGAKPRLKLVLERPLNERLRVGASTRYKYSRQQHLHELLQTVYLDQFMSDSLAIEYKLGAFGDDEIETQVVGYFMNAAIKKRVYRDWLYLSIVPEVNYLRENDWSPFYSLSFELQAVYSE